MNNSPPNGVTNGHTDDDSSNHQTIYSKGIFHGLPDLSRLPNATGLTAVVTGANGISGAHMIRVLGEHPERWTKIYALSRRPPSGNWPKTVEHIPLDFLKSPAEIAQVLKDRNIKPDYIFWFAYILVTSDTGALDWSDRRLVDQNNLILTNFLDALPQADALPKRFFIQFGGKWYGVHLGATTVPMTEDQPPLKGYEENNLYYTQHAIVTAFAKNHNISWSSARPPYVIGAAIDSTQTLLYPIIVYASVQKYLGRPLEYPSDIAAWWAPNSMANATLDSYQFEWQVLAPNTADQSFNASDDSMFTWGRFWPALAKRFGVPYTGPADSDGGKVEWKTREMPADPPPHGLGGRTVRKFKHSFVEWAKQAENQTAWRELAEKHGLRESEWKDVGAIFGRMDLAACGPDAKIMSTMKAKQYGWFGFVDTYESMFSVIDEFVGLKIIPDPSSISPK